MIYFVKNYDMKTIEKQAFNIIDTFVWPELDTLSTESGSHEFKFVVENVKKDFGAEYKFNKLTMSGSYDLTPTAYEDEHIFLSYSGCYDVKIFADDTEIDNEKCRVSLMKQIRNHIEFRL